MSILQEQLSFGASASPSQRQILWLVHSKTTLTILYLSPSSGKRFVSHSALIYNAVSYMLSTVAQTAHLLAHLHFPPD